MADSFSIKYVHPHNWQGDDPGPSGPGHRKVELMLNFRSTGTTGLTGQVILRPAEWRLQGQPGAMELARRVGLESADWGINSKIDYARLYWERNPNEDLLVMCGTGEVCFKHVGGLWDATDAENDNTGNLLLDVVGAADKGAFSAQLRLVLDR